MSISKKTCETSQIIFCCVLIFLMTVLSFMPTLRMTEVPDFDYIFNQESNELYKFNVGILPTLKNIPHIFKAIQVDESEFVDCISTYCADNGKNPLLILLYTMITAFEANFIIFLLLAITAIITVILPIVLWIFSIRCLFGYGKISNTDTFKQYTLFTVTAKLYILYSFSLLSIDLLMPNIRATAVTYIIYALSIIFIVSQTTFNAFKQYTAPQKRYKIILFISSAVELVFSIAFIATLLLSNTQQYFIKMCRFNVIKKFTYDLEITTILLLLINVLLITLVFKTLHYCFNCIERMMPNCVYKKKKNYYARDFYLLNSSAPLFTVLIILFCLINKEYSYEASESVFITLTFIFAAAIFIGELLTKLFNNTISVDISEDGKKCVISGDLYKAKQEDYDQNV